MNSSEDGLDLIVVAESDGREMIASDGSALLSEAGGFLGNLVDFVKSETGVAGTKILANFVK